MQTGHINLREYQESLVARFKGLAQSAPSSSHLGMQVGDEAWMVTLTDVSEVIPVPELTPTPLTLPWFGGIANIRGNLFGVVDLARFLGPEPTPIDPDTRLVLAHSRFRVNAGLLIRRTLGLRNASQSRSRAVSDTEPAWVGGEFEDGEGRIWKELNLRKLVQHPGFLQVGT